MFTNYLLLHDFGFFWPPTPPTLTFSMVWTLTKSGHFWTTYLPRLANVVCERPLIALFFLEFKYVSIKKTWNSSSKIERKIVPMKIELKYYIDETRWGLNLFFQKQISGKYNWAWMYDVVSGSLILDCLEFLFWHFAKE